MKIKVLFVLNILAALAVVVRFVMNCLSIPRTCLLWHDGEIAGYFQIGFLSVILAFMIMTPSLIYWGCESDVNIKRKK